MFGENIGFERTDPTEFRDHVEQSSLHELVVAKDDNCTA